MESSNTDVNTKPEPKLRPVVKRCYYEEEVGGWCGRNCDCHDVVDAYVKEMEEDEANLRGLLEGTTQLQL